MFMHTLNTSTTISRSGWSITGKPHSCPPPSSCACSPAKQLLAKVGGAVMQG